MAGLADAYSAATHPYVQAQVTAAIYAAAANVYGEAGTVSGHASRAALARNVTTGAQSLIPLVYSVCAFASLASDTTNSDTTVNNAVAALWNMWAGA